MVIAFTVRKLQIFKVGAGSKSLPPPPVWTGLISTGGLRLPFPGLLAFFRLLFPVRFSLSERLGQANLVLVLFTDIGDPASMIRKLAGVDGLIYYPHFFLTKTKYFSVINEKIYSGCREHGTTKQIVRAWLN